LKLCTDIWLDPLGSRSQFLGVLLRDFELPR
jgi:hypothetical protein